MKTRSRPSSSKVVGFGKAIPTLLSRDASLLWMGKGLRMIRRFSLWFAMFLLLTLAACRIPKSGIIIGTVTGTPTPGTNIYSNDVLTYPVAQPLEPETLTQAPAAARIWLEKGRQQAINQMPQLSASAFMGPVFIPKDPLQFHKNWVDRIQIAPDKRLTGYLTLAGNMARALEDQVADVLVTLLVDYRQVEFYLGGNLAKAHLVRLPESQYTVFEFALPEPLPLGVHDLVFLVKFDPSNRYAAQAVIEKHRREGKIAFSTAGGYLQDNPAAYRQMVVVGDAPAAPSIPLQDITPLQPEQIGLLTNYHSPLHLALAGDVTDPLLRKEPALVAGEDNQLYAFVYYNLGASENLLPQAKAALFAFLDGKQVPIDGQPAVLWEVQARRRYRIPLRLELPTSTLDGAIHTLHIGLVFGAFEDWRAYEPQADWMRLYSIVFTSGPVPVVPDRGLIDYLWDDR